MISSFSNNILIISWKLLQEKKQNKKQVIAKKRKGVRCLRHPVNPPLNIYFELYTLFTLCATINIFASTLLASFSFLSLL